MSAKSLSTLECWDSVYLSLNSSTTSVSHLKTTDSSRSSGLFNLNHQGQAKQTYLGFLMGFLLIDWGEEFRAELEDWLFSSTLQETGAWHNSGLCDEAAPAPASSAHWRAPASTLYSLELMELAAAQGVNMLLVSRETMSNFWGFPILSLPTAWRVFCVFCLSLSVSLLLPPPSLFLSFPLALPPFFSSFLPSRYFIILALKTF